LWALQKNLHGLQKFELFWTVQEPLPSPEEFGPMCFVRERTYHIKVSRLAWNGCSEKTVHTDERAYLKYMTEIKEKCRRAV